MLHLRLQRQRQRPRRQLQRAAVQQQIGAEIVGNAAGRVGECWPAEGTIRRKRAGCDLALHRAHIDAAFDAAAIFGVVPIAGEVPAPLADSAIEHGAQPAVPVVTKSPKRIRGVAIDQHRAAERREGATGRQIETGGRKPLHGLGQRALDAAGQRGAHCAKRAGDGAIQAGGAAVGQQAAERTDIGAIDRRCGELGQRRAGDAGRHAKHGASWDNLCS